MKIYALRTISFLALSLFIISSCLSQDCSRFYPFSGNVKGELTSYDKKGKVVAVVTYTVKDISSSEGLETATIASEVTDKKGNQIVETSYNITCTGNGISMDFNSLMSPELLGQYKDIDIDVTGTNVELPNDLSPGQTLPDADLNMNLNMSGLEMNISVMMIDREVQNKESITTPAGTFDCYVITYTSKMKMGVGRTGSSKQWVAEGVGLVKQEDYNKKGKLTGSSMLTSFSK